MSDAAVDTPTEQPAPEEAAATGPPVPPPDTYRQKIERLDTGLWSAHVAYANSNELVNLGTFGTRDDAETAVRGAVSAHFQHAAIADKERADAEEAAAKNETDADALAKAGHDVAIEDLEV